MNTSLEVIRVTKMYKFIFQPREIGWVRGFGPN